MTSMTDITEPNRVREQLTASHERFTIVLEALDASVSVARWAARSCCLPTACTASGLARRPEGTWRWWRRRVFATSRLRQW